MGRQLGVALCLAGLLAIGLWFALGTTPDDPIRNAPSDPTELAPVTHSDSPEEFDAPEVVQVAENTLDLGAGSAALAGTITNPLGQPAAAAEVFLYRSLLPTDVEDEGGLSLMRLIDTTGGTQGALRRLGRTNQFPFRREIAEGLEKLASVRADEAGQYRFTGIESGSYLIAARAEASLLTPSPSIEHLTGAETRVDLTLFEAGSLSGSVVGDDGSSIADAKVRILGEVVPVEAGFGALFLAREDLLLYLLNPVTAQARTDADGSFRFTGLPFLDYRIFVEANPWATAEKEHSVPEPAPIEIVLEVGGAIDGLVIDSEGRPVDGVDVTLTVEGGAGFTAAEIGRASCRERV